MNPQEDMCSQTQARLLEFLSRQGSPTRLVIMTLYLFFEIMQLQVDYKTASQRVCLGAPACSPRVGWLRCVQHLSVAFPACPQLLIWARWQRNCHIRAWSLAPEEAGPGEWDSLPGPSSSLKASFYKCPWFWKDRGLGAGGRVERPSQNLPKPEQSRRVVRAGARALGTAAPRWTETGHFHFLKQLVCYEVKAWPSNPTLKALKAQVCAKACGCLEQLHW